MAVDVRKKHDETLCECGHAANRHTASGRLCYEKTCACEQFEVANG